MTNTERELLEAYFRIIERLEEEEKEQQTMGKAKKYLIWVIKNLDKIRNK